MTPELQIDPGPDVGLRAVGDSDLPFLANLYASTREEELRPLGWTSAEKGAFLAHQFACQHEHYQTHYESARFDVIERAGEAIGRLYLALVGEEIRIVDVALLPDWRGRGLGTHLLCAVIERARAERRRVSIHVERNSPALRLYRRLGFELREDRGVYLFLVHSAGASEAKA